MPGSEGVTCLPYKFITQLCNSEGDQMRNKFEINGILIA